MSLKYNVLCIGVNGVPAKGSPKNRLTYAEKDARAVATYFEALKDNADVTLLTGEKATREAVFDWLNQCRSISTQVMAVIFLPVMVPLNKMKIKKAWNAAFGLTVLPMWTSNPIS